MLLNRDYIRSFLAYYIFRSGLRDLYFILRFLENARKNKLLTISNHIQNLIPIFIQNLIFIH